MYDEMNSGTGSYYDTGSGYTHYDSSSNLHKPEKKKGFGKTNSRGEKKYFLWA